MIKVIRVLVECTCDFFSAAEAAAASATASETWRYVASSHVRLVSRANFEIVTVASMVLPYNWI